MKAGARLWVLVALALGLPSLALSGVVPLTSECLAWNHVRAYLHHPWTAWTSAWLHANALHLAANLAGLSLVTFLGCAANIDRRSSYAWLFTWPATQILLLPFPTISFCYGLSGVLHAGAAIVALHLLSTRPAPRAARSIGWFLLLGILVKLVVEQAWNPAIELRASMQMNVLPMVHLTGVLSALAAGLYLRISKPREFGSMKR